MNSVKETGNSLMETMKGLIVPFALIIFIGVYSRSFTVQFFVYLAI